MKDSPGFDLKEAWVIASVSVLVVYFLGQLKPDSELGRMATPDWLIAWMFLLSFPASFLALALASSLILLGYDPTLPETIFIWTVMFAAGYWQWFGVVPWLLPKDQQLITLKLERKNKESLDARGMDAGPAYDSVWIIEEEKASLGETGAGQERRSS